MDDISVHQGILEGVFHLTTFIMEIPTGIVADLWGIALTPYTPLFFIITGLIDGLLYVAIQDYINKMIPSERRATVLSFQSMTFSFYMIIFFPVIGIFGDRFGLEYSFMGLAVAGTVMYGFYLLFTRKIFKT